MDEQKRVEELLARAESLRDALVRTADTMENGRNRWLRRAQLREASVAVNAAAAYLKETMESFR